MGVHGLTNFISQYHNRYKEKMVLRNCPVVIDGCNLMYHLYFDGKSSVVARGPGKKSESSKNVPNAHLFGGDWEHYAQNVRYFFQQLKQCEITALVLMDGAYDSSKLGTANSRLEQAIKENVKKGRPEDPVVYPGKTYTPIFLKTVFLEVLSEQKIPHYQTIGEADCTIAYVAHILGDCPILSSDSDFFIYINAKALPLGSLKFKQAAVGKKRHFIRPDWEEPEPDWEFEPYPPYKVWTLQSEFVSLPKLCREEFNLKDPRLLPLAAVILGNDFIQSRVFKNFQSFKAGGNLNSKGGRITSIMKWLGRQPSLDSALKTLLGFVPEGRREKTEFAMNSVIKMYEGNGGEKRIWMHVKKDVDLKGWINPEAEITFSHLELLEAEYEDSLKEGIHKEMGGVDAIKSMAFIKDKENQDVLNHINDTQETLGAFSGTEGSDPENVKVHTQRLESKVCESVLPIWYLHRHTLCQFQTYLLNIYKNQMVFLPPQVELYEKASSHDLSIPIIRVTAGIILCNEANELMLISRKKATLEKRKVRPTHHLEIYEKLPSLFEGLVPSKEFWQCISHEKRYAIIIEALGLKDDEIYSKYIQGWPSSYRIWIACLLRYVLIRTSEPSTGNRLLHLSVGIAILFSVIKNLLVNPSPSPGPEKLQKVRSFYRKFEDFSEVTTKKFMKNYDICIPYSLSEYLALLFHTEMLNNLLGNPFKSPKVRYQINNFFVYSLSQKIYNGLVKVTDLENDDLICKIARSLGETELEPWLVSFLGHFDLVGDVNFRQAEETELEDGKEAEENDPENEENAAENKENEFEESNNSEDEVKDPEPCKKAEEGKMMS